MKYEARNLTRRDKKFYAIMGEAKGKIDELDVSPEIKEGLYSQIEDVAEMHERWRGNYDLPFSLTRSKAEMIWRGLERSFRRLEKFSEGINTLLNSARKANEKVKVANERKMVAMGLK